MSDARDLLSNALAEGSEWLRLRETENILRELSANERRENVDIVLAASKDFHNDQIAARLLIKLATLLPEADRSKIVSAARPRISAVQDPDVRSRLLTELTMSAGGDEDKRGLFFTALSQGLQTSVLLDTLPYVSKADLEPVLDQVIEAGIQASNDYLAGRLLYAVIPLVPEAERQSIAEIAAKRALKVTDPTCRMRVADGLVEFVSMETRFALTVSVVAGESRTRALIQLLTELTGDMRRRCIRHLLDELPHITDLRAWQAVIQSLIPHDITFTELMGVIEERGLSYFSRQEDFRAIAEILADIEVENRDKAIERIITVVWAKDWKSKGKTVIQALLPSLSQTLRTELLETLIASSTRVADRCDRALALAELLQLIVPETERSDIARRALNALEHIDDSQKRAEALVKVAAEVSSAAPDVFIHFLFDWIDDSEIDTVMTAVLRQKSAIAASLLAGLIERAGIVSDPIFRSRLFCKILAVAPEDVNSESLFDEAVKSLTEVPDPLTRLRAYIDTFQTVPDRFKTRWLASASQSLDSLEDPLIALQLFTNRLDSSSWPEIGRIIELTSRDEYKRQFQIAIKQEKARRHEEAINRKAYGIQERFGFGRSSRNFEAAEEALTSHANLRSKSISVVNTGFCNEAGDMLEAGGRLLSGREYYFWLEISPLLPQSIEKKPTPLPPLPPDSELTVVLWEIDDGLRIREGSDIARLRVLRDGTAEVVKQPGFTPRATHEDLRRRAYFPLHISGCSGVQRFRCNIYCADALIQSRLIRALIVSQPTTAMGELSSEIDYAISRDLDPAYLRRLSPHQLSIMLSDETDANVSFAFFGASGAEIVKHESKFDPLELQDAIQQARNVLRSLAWGDEGDWNIGKKYRYSERIGPAQMRDDFVSLAIRGYRLYDMAIDRLSGGRERAGALANLMRKPGVVQIALNASPRYLMPVALMYDFNLDTGAPRDRYKLCSGFLAALGGKAPLRDSPCFSGACPSRIGDESAITICPGGFWGFRHRIGVPLSSESREAPAVIGCEGELRVAAARSTDPAFRLWAAHEKTLRAVFGETSWQCAESRSDALRLLKERDPHMVYFYCHGGTSGNIPYLQVGPLEDTVITRDNLRSAEIRWVKTRPLVFINGCNTAAVEPARGMEFVSALMGLAAAGVIGTDITLFEPLACAFAEECFRLFAGGFEIGEAIREARLALLKNGNPLGLLYTPYSLATLRLVRTPLQPS